MDMVNLLGGKALLSGWLPGYNIICSLWQKALIIGLSSFSKLLSKTLDMKNEIFFPLQVSSRLCFEDARNVFTAQTAFLDLILTRVVTNK